jgi:hypothetical protein
MVKASCSVFISGECFDYVRDFVNHCIIGGCIVTSDAEKLKIIGKFLSDIL